MQMIQALILLSLLALSPTSSVDDILNALDARGQNLTDFSANVKLSETDSNTGDTTVTSGEVSFARKPDGEVQMHIHFDKIQRPDGATRPDDRDYVLIDGWLDERDNLQKTDDKRQIAQPGEKMDLFKLAGPIALPIGQKPEDVKNLFDVKKVDPAKGDPPNTVHIQLTPIPHTHYAGQFKTIDVWVDCNTNMPCRIETLDAQETTDKTTDLSNVKLNLGLPSNVFDLPPIPEHGWQQIVEPFK